MSGTAISQLPAALSALPTDLLPLVEIGTPNVTKRITLAQLLAGNTVPPSGGVFTGVIEFDQGLLLDNNQYLQWRNNVGNPQNVITLNGSNNVVLQTYGSGFTFNNSSATSVASIDASGNIATQGNITASGTLTLGNTLGINYSRGNSFSFGWDGTTVHAYVDNGDIGQLATTGWVNGNFATFGWVNGNFKPASSYTPNQNVDNGSSPSFGNVNASGTLTGNRLQLQSSGSFFDLYLDGAANRVIDFQSGGWKFQYEASSGNLDYWSATGVLLHSHIGSGDFAIAGLNAFKPGGGTWAAPSDPRIKSVTGPYTKGLADLWQLQPIVYQYTGNEARTQLATGKEMVGLDAAATEPVWPSLVLTGDAVIDGQPVDDLKLIDANEVTWALVNAVKELSARVAALEAGRA